MWYFQLTNPSILSFDKWVLCHDALGTGGRIDGFYGPAIAAGSVFLYWLMWDFAVLYLSAKSQERKVFMQKLSFKVPIGLSSSPRLSPAWCPLEAAFRLLQPTGLGRHTITSITLRCVEQRQRCPGRRQAVLASMTLHAAVHCRAAGVTISGLGMVSGTDYLGIRFAGGFFDVPVVAAPTT